MGPGPAPRGGDALLTAYARSLVQFKSRLLCRKPGFSRSDQPDLEQDLLTVLVEQAARYDAGRGASPDTFADRVVDSAAKMILRSRRRPKRAAGFASKSLDTGTVEVQGKHVPISEVLGSKERRTDNSPASPADVADLREAVRHALSGLPPFTVEVAHRLQDGAAVAAIARHMGVSRRQVSKAMAELHERFEEAGLDD